MISVHDIPQVHSAAWAQQAYRFLADIPPIPSVDGFHFDDPELALHVRMYSVHEARAWVASNLMWFEEVAQLLSDARLGLTSAVTAYSHGFPSPPADDTPAIPGVLLRERQAPAYDAGTIERARMFRYFIDDAVIRISAAFEKTSGLLGSYYSIDFRNKGELLSELHKRHPEATLLRRMEGVLRSPTFRDGQEYRNPRIHSLGNSFRALYGGRPEIAECQVISPGCMGIRTRPVVTADQLFELAKAFYGAAFDFARAAVGLVQAHPRFTSENPFVARRIQRPVLHRGVDENKMPIDWTDEFSTVDEQIGCTALVHSAKGRKLTIRWRLGRQVDSSQDVAIGEDRELKVTCWIGPDPGQRFQPGRGSVEWRLDDEVTWKVRFKVVEST